MDQHTLIGTGELARKVDLPRARLIQLLDAGKLPDTTLTVAGRRLFRPADMRAVEQALDAAKTGRAGEARR